MPSIHSLSNRSIIAQEKTIVNRVCLIIEEIPNFSDLCQCGKHQKNKCGCPVEENRTTAFFPRKANSFPCICTVCIQYFVCLLQKVDAVLTIMQRCICYTIICDELAFCRCNTRILNIITPSYDGRPPFRVLSFRITALFRMSPDISQLMTLFSVSSGLPVLLIVSALFPSSRRLLCHTFMFLLYHVPSCLYKDF